MRGMRYQPQGAARIAATPLARGLRVVLSGGNGASRPVVGPDVTMIGAPTSGFNTFGKCIQFNGVNQALSIPLDLRNTQAVTVLALVDIAEVTSTQQVLWEFGPDTVGARRGFSAYFRQSAMEVWAGMNGTGREGNIYSAPTVGSHVVATVFDLAQSTGSKISLYMDGALQSRTSLSSAGSAVAYFPNDTLYLSARTASNFWANDRIALLLVFDRALSSDEIASISKNPWQLFADPEEYGAIQAVSNSYSLSVGRAAMAVGGGLVAMRAARRIRVQPAAFTTLAGPVRLQVSRRFGVQPAAMALAGKGVALRAGRRLALAPLALALTGGAVGMQYNPAKPPGSYTLPVSAAAMQLGAGNVGMRVSRRLAVAPAQLQVVAGAVRALVGRRLLVGGARLVAQGRSVTLRYSAAAPPFDITKIHPSRVVIFEGSGSRVTPFEGSGSRATPFDGSGSRVTPFEGSGSRVTRFE